MRKRAEVFTLLDVREPWELAKASMEGSKNIPMGEVTARAQEELNPEEHIVVVCHHGVRSLTVTSWPGSRDLRRRSRCAVGLMGGPDCGSQSAVVLEVANTQHLAFSGFA